MNNYGRMNSRGAAMLGLGSQHPMSAHQSSRRHDIEESRALLLELGTYEPTLQQCIKIIQNTCLSQGIQCSIDGVDCSDAFHEHINDHYMTFLRDALRSMIVFGFVPWRLRRVRSGDKIPEVLPAGTFDWHTEAQDDTANRGKRAGGSSGYSVFNQPGRFKPHATGYHSSASADTEEGTGEAWRRLTDDATCLVIYRVTPSAGGLNEDDIRVYSYIQPALEVTANSVLFATVPTPLAHIITDYRNLRSAQIRKAYADAWNTTAQIVSVFRPKLAGQDDPTQYLMDFVHESHYNQPAMLENPLFPALEARNWFERDQMIRRMFERPGLSHHPQVYTLPRDHELAKQDMLTPCEDIEFLMNKYRRDICSLTGVPHEMIEGREAGGQETVRRTMASGRVFSTNMQEYCKHCERLLKQVYEHIYGRRRSDNPSMDAEGARKRKAGDLEGADGSSKQETPSAEKLAHTKPDTPKTDTAGDPKQQLPGSANDTGITERGVRFILSPMPRLEIECIEDFKVLYDIGALTPDMSIQLSRVLLGVNQQHRRAQQRQNSKPNKPQTIGEDGGGGASSNFSSNKDGEDKKKGVKQPFGGNGGKSQKGNNEAPNMNI